MVKNSAEGNKARAARYRAALAARGIRPVQLLAPEGAHALLRQATGLMTREQDPVEPRQALRQASGANDPREGTDELGELAQVHAAAVEAVKAQLAKARDAERQAEQRALAQAEAARVAEEGAVAAQARAEAAERAREDAARELRAAEAAAERARVEAERFQKAPGLRGRAIRWLAR